MAKESNKHRRSRQDTKFDPSSGTSASIVTPTSVASTVSREDKRRYAREKFSRDSANQDSVVTSELDSESEATGIPGSFQVEGPGMDENERTRTSTQVVSDNTNDDYQNQNNENLDMPVALPASVVSEVVLAVADEEKEENSGEIKIKVKWILLCACLVVAVAVGVAVGLAVALVNDNGPAPITSTDLDPTPGPTSPPLTPSSTPPPSPSPSILGETPTTSLAPSSSPEADTPPTLATDSPTPSPVIQSFDSCVCWYYQQQVHLSSINDYKVLSEERKQYFNSLYQALTNQYDPNLRKLGQLRRRMAEGVSTRVFLESQQLFGDFEWNAPISGIDMAYQLEFCGSGNMEEYHTAYAEWMSILDNRYGVVERLIEEVGLVSAYNLTVPQRYEGISCTT